jgi:hypothetical protein
VSLFSRFFGSSQKRELYRIFENARRQTDKEFGPVGRLGSEIIAASTHCRDQVKPLLTSSDEKERVQSEIFIFYEFIYFFLHLTNRYAHKVLSSEEMSKLHEYLGPLVSSVAIDAYFAHWPADLKERMLGEFYEKLNTAELEYTEAGKRSGSNEEGLSQLFTTLGNNVSMLASDDNGDGDISQVASNVAIEEFGRRDFQRMVQDVGTGFQ